MKIDLRATFTDRYGKDTTETVCSVNYDSEQINEIRKYQSSVDYTSNYGYASSASPN